MFLAKNVNGFHSYFVKIQQTLRPALNYVTTDVGSYLSLKKTLVRPFHQSSILADIECEEPIRTLTPEEANFILRENEQFLQLQDDVQSNWNEALSAPSMHAIVSVDSNQLASNTPIEDKLAAAKCIQTPGFLVGVFDGHGGTECSRVVSKRLFDYVAASILPRSELLHIISECEIGKPLKLTTFYNDNIVFNPELQKIYDLSLLNWCKHLYHNIGQEFSMEEALTGAFLQLDEDLGNEVLENQNESVHETLLQTVLSGSVACVAHIDGPHLHVANSGDCGCVIGEVAEDSHGGWVPVRLTQDHNWENVTEIKRILSEHPKDEESTVLQSQRLLGILMPFRAFGDFRFKWDVTKQKRIFGPLFEEDNNFLKFLRTPPYLTAKPEVTYHYLNPREKFMILASDGLWESLGMLDIVTIIGDYMSGRQTLHPVSLPRRHVTLNELLQLLKKRREWLKLKPIDANASTHLIRHCLGSTEEGLDHYRLSHSLTLPPEVRRYFRDDISTHIVFFDSNFIRICPTPF